MSNFVLRKVVRGFGVIKHLWSLINRYNAFICGGYVRYMVSPRKNPVPAGDVDIYCKDEDTYQRLKEVFVKEDFSKKYESDVAISFTNENNPLYKLCPTVQLIKPVKGGGRINFIGDMHTILSHFDFSVIRCGLLSPSEAYVDEDFEKDEENLRLRIKNIVCPISSISRCMKYSKKGYWLKPTEALKILKDWEDRPNDYKEKITDFLRKVNQGEGLSKEEVEEMEALMLVD